MRKDFKRRTNTNSGEEKTHFENGEDRRFAPKKDKWGCPLTANVPRQIPSTFFGAPKILFEKNKEKN